MTDSVRRLRAALGRVRRGSPLERDVPRATMAMLPRRARAQVPAFQLRVLRTEQVTMVGFADVLADVAARHAGHPVVLKLNVEGAAGDCLPSVPPAALGRLEILLVDLEANTPQPLDDVLAHISRAGFELLAERELVYHFVKRSGP